MPQRPQEDIYPLSAHVREGIYRRQTGKRDLTARQRRRVEHKRNRADKRAKRSKR
jgi:hypothetical protein